MGAVFLNPVVTAHPVVVPHVTVVPHVAPPVAHVTPPAAHPVSGGAHSVGGGGAHPTSGGSHVTPSEPHPVTRPIFVPHVYTHVAQHQESDGGAASTITTSQELHPASNTDSAVADGALYFSMGAFVGLVIVLIVRKLSE